MDSHKGAIRPFVDRVEEEVVACRVTGLLAFLLKWMERGGHHSNPFFHKSEVDL